MNGARIYTSQITLNPPAAFPGDGSVSFYAVDSDPTGQFEAEVGDRAWQIGSTNTWVCTGGTAWEAAGTPAEEGSLRAFVWKPSATEDDPAKGIYTTFSAAHAAARAAIDPPADPDVIPVPGFSAPPLFPVDLYVWGQTATLSETGTYDMNLISLRGLPQVENRARTTLTVANDVVFRRFRFVSDIDLRYSGSGTFYTVDTTFTGGNHVWSNAVVQSTGDGTVLRVTGAFEAEFYLYNTEVYDTVEVLAGTLRLFVDDNSYVGFVPDNITPPGVCEIVRVGGSTVDTFTRESDRLTVSSAEIPYEPVEYQTWWTGDAATKPTSTGEALDLVVTRQRRGELALPLLNAFQTGTIIPDGVDNFKFLGMAEGATPGAVGAGTFGPGILGASTELTSGDSISPSPVTIADTRTPLQRSASPYFASVFAPTGPMWATGDFYWFCGFATDVADVIESDTPIGQYAGFSISTYREGTGSWVQFITNGDGGEFQAIDTGVQLQIGRLYLAEVELRGSDAGGAATGRLWLLSDSAVQIDIGASWALLWEGEVTTEGQVPLQGYWVHAYSDGDPIGVSAEHYLLSAAYARFVPLPYTVAP